MGGSHGAGKDFIGKYFGGSEDSIDGRGVRESQVSDCGVSDAGTSFGCGGEIMGVDLDYELDWGVKRMKFEGGGYGVGKGDLKHELRYVVQRKRMLEDCLNVKRCHESYFYKRNNELCLKKNGVEDDCLIPALDYFSTLE